MANSEVWTKKVGRVFNTRPRIASQKGTVWLERKHTMQHFAESFARPGAHVCLDGPSGAGKTSLALTHIFRQGINHAAIQVTEQMEWPQFCRLLISDVSNREWAVSGEMEVGINKALPVAKFRLSLGSKNRPSDDITYLDKVANMMTEQDVAKRLSEMNAALYVDDVERANDRLLGRLSDLCKILTQGYVADNAKVVFVGSGEIYQRLYRCNPSLDERLLQVSLGAFKFSADSWRFIARGFEKLRLRHPGNSQFPGQRHKQEKCAHAIWEAADGLPKSLNRLGQEIALRYENRSGVSFTDILSEANRMSEDHWIEYGTTFSDIVRFLQGSASGVAVLQCLYEHGIARIHQFRSIVSHAESAAKKIGRTICETEIDDAIGNLTKLHFLVRTGKSGEIIFTRHPAAAHTLGVVMRDPNRFKSLPDAPKDAPAVRSAFPVQEELAFMEYTEEPEWDV